MIRLSVTSTALVFCISLHSVAASQTMKGYAPGEVMVKFKSIQRLSKNARGVLSTGSVGLDNVLQRFGVFESRPLFGPENSEQNLRIAFGMDRVSMLRFSSAANIDSIVHELNALPEVEYAEPDYSGQGAGVAGIDSLLPDDTYFTRQWGFRNTGSNLSGNSGKPGSDIKATMAWPICKGDTNIIVAILDSGLKWDHPDIADRVWVNRKEIAGNGIDDDNNGYVDDIRGWNFASGSNDVSDDLGHGTNTAGIIGAKANNGLGYAGLDWRCKIMPLKELDSANHGYYSWWASALYYAANNGARVISMSEGGTSPSQTLKTAIDYAYAHGCFIAAAMMNTNDTTRYYPAAYHDNVTAVGATDSYDRRCNPFSWGGGSNYGAWIDVVAPGNVIYGLNNKSNTDYSWYWSGTSQATPMVAGLASLLLAQDPTRSPAILRNIIRATADDTVGLQSEDMMGYDVHYGYGRINSYKALTYSLNESGPWAPFLGSPMNGALGLSASLTLNWEASTGATSYRLQVSNTSSFATMAVDDSTVTLAAKTVGPLPGNTKYYWRASAKGNGGRSSWSAAWNFTVGRVRGDVDGNGLIQAADATLVLRHVAGIAVLNDPEALNAADASKDGTISAYDAGLILQAAAGLINLSNAQPSQPPAGM